MLISSSKTASMEAFNVLLIASLVCVSLAEVVNQDPSSVPLAYQLNSRFKRQQGTLQQQVNTLQQQSGQRPGQQGFGGSSQKNGQTGNAFQFQPQNSNNNQGSTVNDAETQRVNNCIQQNCRQGVQLASLCGTDNVSYKNRPYFNCVRDCGRRIEVQHFGDCFTTRGPPNALSTG